MNLERTRRTLTERKQECLDRGWVNGAMRIDKMLELLAREDVAQAEGRHAFIAWEADGGLIKQAGVAEVQPLAEFCDRIAATLGTEPDNVRVSRWEPGSFELWQSARVWLTGHPMIGIYGGQ